MKGRTNEKLEALRDLPLGESYQILDNVYLIKVDKHQYRYGNMYVVVHPFRKSLLLIDAVRKESKAPIAQFIKDGYGIDGVLLTHSDLIDQSYADAEAISNDLEGASVYIHPLDVKAGWEEAYDTMNANLDFVQYGIKVYHFPGHTPGSVVIYSPVNDGILFSGDSAVGSPYDADDYYFERPPNKEDALLQEKWVGLNEDFKHFLPLHGKPEFNISAERKEDILQSLRKKESTKTL